MDCFSMKKFHDFTKFVLGMYLGLLVGRKLKYTRIEIKQKCQKHSIGRIYNLFWQKSNKNVQSFAIKIQ